MLVSQELRDDVGVRDGSQSREAIILGLVHINFVPPRFNRFLGLTQFIPARFALGSLHPTPRVYLRIKIDGVLKCRDFQCFVIKAASLEGYLLFSTDAKKTADRDIRPVLCNLSTFQIPD